MTLVAHRVAKVGGMERAYAELAEGLLASGYEVRVISRECDLPAHPKLRKILIYSPNRPFLFAYALFFLRGSIATWRHRRGLVHVLGAIVGNRADVATVQFCHHGFSLDGARGRGRRQSLFYAANAWLAHALSVLTEKLVYGRERVRWLLPASQGVACELERSFPHFRSRQTTIPNGVDREAFAPRPAIGTRVRDALGLDSADLVAAFVGGDWERKGLQFVVEALATLPEWHLVVVGEGPAERYASRARDLGVDQRIRFVGRQTDTAGYLAAADAFVLPTAYEAFPLVMLEAAACAVPVLITRVNGADEFVEDGVNGFFVERSAEGVEAGLRRLAEVGGEGRRTVGRAARAATERYTWDRIVDSHLAVYEMLQESRPRGARTGVNHLGASRERSRARSPVKREASEVSAPTRR